MTGGGTLTPLPDNVVLHHYKVNGAPDPVGRKPYPIPPRFAILPAVTPHEMPEEIAA
jgi:hypothetical protein